MRRAMVALATSGLLWAIIGPAAAQDGDITAAAKKVRMEWEQCVRLAAELWAPPVNDILGPAEYAFRSCNAEEQAVVVLAQVMSPDRWAVILAPFYKSKLDLKKQLTDNYFKSLSKKIGP